MIEHMLKYLGELDCEADLASIVGEQEAARAWCGKLCYFLDLSDRHVFGVSDVYADSLFESGAVI